MTNLDSQKTIQIGLCLIAISISLGSLGLAHAQGFTVEEIQLAYQTMSENASGTPILSTDKESFVGGDTVEFLCVPDPDDGAYDMILNSTNASGMLIITWDENGSDIEMLSIISEFKPNTDGYDEIRASYTFTNTTTDALVDCTYGSSSSSGTYQHTLQHYDLNVYYEPFSLVANAILMSTPLNVPIVEGYWTFHDAQIVHEAERVKVLIDLDYTGTLGSCDIDVDVFDIELNSWMGVSDRKGFYCDEDPIIGLPTTLENVFDMRLTINEQTPHTLFTTEILLPNTSLIPAE